METIQHKLRLTADWLLQLAEHPGNEPVRAEYLDDEGKWVEMETTPALMYDALLRRHLIRRLPNGE